MKKKLLLLPIISVILATASCRPIFVPDSGPSYRPSVDPSFDPSYDPSVEPSEHHTHEREATWSYNRTNHWHACIAHDGYQFDLGFHNFNDVVVEPTYTTGGYTLHTCVICGYNYKDNYTEPKQHNYSPSWSHNESTHWHQCIDPGYTNLKKDEANHSYINTVVAPTFETMGYTRHTCSVCGYYFDDTYVPAKEHNYSDSWTYNESTHWHACTDAGYTHLKKDETNHNMVTTVIEPTTTTSGYTHHECSVCHYYYDDSVVPPIEEHHFSEEWTTNSTHHWHICTDPGCTAIDAYATHIMVEEQYIAPDYDHDGYRLSKCSVCGYELEETLPKLVHHYEEGWTTNETNHWHACTDVGYEDLKDGDAPHTFVEAVIEPTYTSEGYTNHTCSVCGYSYQDNFVPALVHHYSDEWSADDETHWHACTDIGYEDEYIDKADHDFDTEFIEEPNYMTYYKGYYKYTCSICGKEVIGESVYYTKNEMCDLMNDALGSYNRVDVFETRDYLAELGFPIIDSLDEELYFGYDETSYGVVVTDGTSILYPNEIDNLDTFVSYREIEASSVNEVKNAMQEIYSGNKSYSTVKLTSDIVLDSTTGPIYDNAPYPIQFDLNGHSVTTKALANGGLNDYMFKVNNENAYIVIKNGTIETFEDSGVDLTISPACVGVLGGSYVHLHDLHMINRALRGYSYIDSPYLNSGIIVNIDNNVIDSIAVGLCIQRGNYDVQNNEINGLIVINGGYVSIINNVISSVDVHNVANESITNEDLYLVARDRFTGVDTIMVHAADPILIYDRRSAYSTYDSPYVTIEGNEFTVKTYNEVILGYAVRYIDMELDPNKESNRNNIIIDNNIYNNIPSGPVEDVYGGYSFYQPA